MIDMASLILFYRGGRELLISGISLEDAKRFSRSDKTVNKKEGWFVGFSESDSPQLSPHEDAKKYLLDLWRSGDF